MILMPPFGMNEVDRKRHSSPLLYTLPNERRGYLRKSLFAGPLFMTLIGGNLTK
jgi:hypothetical protein